MIAAVMARARNNEPSILRVLDEMGYKTSWRVRHGMAMRAAFVAVIAVVIFAAASLKMCTLNNVDIASATIALSALLFAYQQWIEAKHESSIDKYYERLSITNERLKDPEIRCKLKGVFPSIVDETYETKFYVYLELDNLEFSILKYQNGYLTPDMAYRSLLTFLSRSRSRLFLKHAKEAVGGRLGYLSITKTVIDNIANPDKQRWLKENVF